MTLGLFARDAFQLPEAAVLFQMLLAIGFILVSKVQDLLSYLGLTLSLCAAMTVGCLFLPSLRRRSWIHPTHWCPLLYVAATIAAAVVRGIREPAEILTALGTFAIGATMYGASKWSARASTP